MRVNRILLGLAAASATATAAVVAGERRLLRAMDQADPPDHWHAPRFPKGALLMVPADDGAELVVALAGPEDGPVVALVHGLTSNHHDWGPVATRLVDDGFRVIGINQRGHGGSTVGSDGFSPARQGADIGQVLKALDVGDVTLVGHSMGGVAVMSLLALRPDAGADRVGSLVLIGTLAHTQGADRKAALKVGNTRTYRELATHPNHAAVIARFVFGDLPNRELVDHALGSYDRCPHETRVGAAEGLAEYDIRPHLEDIDRPTTVLCGTKDRLTPHSENEAIAGGIPDADFVSVAGAGHLVIWERAPLVAGTIAGVAKTARNQAHA